MSTIQKEIDQLGLNQKNYAKLLKRNIATIQRWVAGTSNRPPDTELYTKLLLDNPDLLPQAWVNAGYPPEGPPMSKAGRPVEREDKV